jgi:hypothetical protein
MFPAARFFKPRAYLTAEFPELLLQQVRCCSVCLVT